MTKYTLKDEHKAFFKPIVDKWIKNAFRTKPMTEEDREKCREAILKMYALAKLKPPKNIVFVPSPFVLRFAAGYASWIWYCRKHNPNLPTACTELPVEEGKGSAEDRRG